MTKALLWRFRKYLGRFHILNVKACSVTMLLGEWSNQDFGSGLIKSVISEIHQLWQSSFFSTCLTFYVDSRKGTEKSEKTFGFADNCIWIRSNKYSHSWTGYLASPVNVLTNTPKISPNPTGDIFGMNFPENDEKQVKALSWRFCK